MAYRHVYIGAKASCWVPRLVERTSAFAGATREVLEVMVSLLLLMRSPSRSWAILIPLREPVSFPWLLKMSSLLPSAVLTCWHGLAVAPASSRQQKTSIIMLASLCALYTCVPAIPATQMKMSDTCLTNWHANQASNRRLYLSLSRYSRAVQRSVN